MGAWGVRLSDHPPTVLVSRGCSLSWLHGLVALILEWVSPGTEALDLGRDSNGRRIGCPFVFPTSLMLRTEALGLRRDSNGRRIGCSQALPMPRAANNCALIAACLDAACVSSTSGLLRPSSLAKAYGVSK